MVQKEENILLAAEELFAEKGFAGASTREISKKANVNISMISYYFGSKEKLYEKIFENRMTESLNFTKDVLANADLDEWEKLERIINRYAERVKTLKSFYKILQWEQLSGTNKMISNYLKESRIGFLTIYSELIKNGNDRKIFNHEPRLEFVHSTISGTLFTALTTLPVYKTFFEGKDDYEDQYFEEIKIHIKTILKNLLGYEKNI